MKTVEKKKRFLEAQAAANNITDSCKAADIARQTYYQWLKDDPEFVQACADIDESLLDHVEGKLLAAIDAGDKESTRWYLAHKGRSRGYSDKVISEHSGTLEFKIVKEVMDELPAEPSDKGGEAA